MNVLSLFDGMSCGQIALERAGIKVDNYYASEIEETPIKVTMDNYPKTIQLGDVTKLHWTNYGFETDTSDHSYRCFEYKGNIDLLIGGSPCQDISNLNKFKEGLAGEKSKLFYQYWRMWQETKPKYFLLENVAGDKGAIDKISSLMGVRPIRISSNWVSAQNRMRCYWTNIPVNTLPKKKHLFLKDILEENVDEKYFIKDGRLNWLLSDSGIKSTKKRFTGIDTIRAGCLTKRGEKSWNCNYVTDNGRIRKLTPIEYERLQTVPDNYTCIASDIDRYEMLGNGWTIDIIAHIFKHMKL